VDSFCGQRTLTTHAGLDAPMLSDGPQKLRPPVGTPGAQSELTGYEHSDSSTRHLNTSAHSETRAPHGCRSPGTMIVQNTRLHETAD
jgi:hypothetical protein